MKIVFWLGRLIKGGWKLIFTLGALVGILYLPADILGIQNAYPDLSRFLPSRQHALVGFAIACCGYIAWIEIRGWASKQKTKIVSRPVKLTAQEKRARDEIGAFAQNVLMPVSTDLENMHRTIGEYLAEKASSFDNRPIRPIVYNTVYTKEREKSEFLGPLMDDYQTLTDNEATRFITHRQAIQNLNHLLSAYFVAYARFLEVMDAARPLRGEHEIEFMNTWNAWVPRHHDLIRRTSQMIDGPDFAGLAELRQTINELTPVPNIQDYF